jgi:hypothetical protein
MLEKLAAFQPFNLHHWFVLPLMLIAFIGIGWVAPLPCLRFARTVDRVLFALSRKRVIAIALPGLLAAAAGAIFWAAKDFPNPRIHDEFSYLLAADTFAHGRVTNAPHPLWRFFETFHEIQQPTYASMYPPGQGLVLAAGTVLFGHPWFGVYLSVVILCMTVVWALRAWIPPQWAFAGGVFAATITSFSYWMTSYWGGAVAATGGAVLLGAWRRLERRLTIRDSLLFATGIVILANTRIYEGGALALVAGAGLVRSALLHPVAPLRVYLHRVALPIGVVSLAAASWMLFYFWRVTGDPLLMPYVLNARTYNFRRMFLWQHDRPEPVYRHEVMRKLYSEIYRVDRSDWQTTKEQLKPVVDHYVGSLALLIIGAAPWLIRRRSIRGLLIATAAVIIAISFSTHIRAHYIAPAMTGFIGLTLVSLLCLRDLRVPGRRVGLFAANALLVVWLGAQWISGLASFFADRPELKWAEYRAQVGRDLEQTGEQHLILVRYNKFHSPHQEWVFNGADLFHAPVLWARDMGADQNQALIQYYQGRMIWLLQPDGGPLLLTPYPRH